MRSRIRKEVLRLFERELERCLPHFQRVRTKTDTPLWTWQLDAKLTFFVMLQSIDKKDQFLLEIAWSEDGQFPWPTLPSHPPKREAPAFRERLARLWATGKTADVWAVVPDLTDEEREQRISALERGDTQGWLREVLEDEALPRVEPLVKDAVQKLIDFGMPVFRQVAEHRHIHWPLAG